MECVIKKAAELKPERFRDAVVACAEQLRRNLKLTTLNLGLPAVKPEWRSPQPEELFRLLDGFEMRTSAAEARKRYALSGAATPATGAVRVEKQTELF